MIFAKVPYEFSEHPKVLNDRTELFAQPDCILQLLTHFFVIDSWDNQEAVSLRYLIKNCTRGVILLKSSANSFTEEHSFDSIQLRSLFSSISITWSFANSFCGKILKLSGTSSFNEILRSTISHEVLIKLHAVDVVEFKLLNSASESHYCCRVLPTSILEIKSAFEYELLLSLSDLLSKFSYRSLFTSPKFELSCLQLVVAEVWELNFIFASDTEFAVFSSFVANGSL